MPFRRPFRDVIDRQLALFEREHADLLQEIAAAERAYDRSERDEAEERYGDFVDLVETAGEALAAAARELLDDSTALAEARAGARRARETLTWDAAAAAHLALYRELT